MNNTFISAYQSKLTDKESTLRLIAKEDRILAFAGSSTILSLLDDHYQQLNHVSLYTMFLLTKGYRFLTNETEGHICHYATFVSSFVREAVKDGSAPEIILSYFSDTDDFVRNRVKPTVLMTQVTPMDENGYFTMGYNSLGHKVALEYADRVIVHVNKRLPVICGECNRLHISQVSAVFEEEAPIPTTVIPPFTDEDIKAAQFVADRIPDGATIQIGVGRTPDAVGSLLMDHKHLGIHSELFSLSIMQLMKAGAADNSRKSLLPGLAVFGFVGGSRASAEGYEYVGNNPNVMMYPISWVNDPRVVAQNDNFVSVNSALAVDLTGQVCSETIGLRSYSGPGGQVDFVRGARWAKNGQSFIILNSAVKKEDGTRISKIDLALTPGSSVTTSRHDVDNIATEYGIAELRFKSLAERARALIAIAHPEFRDELTYKAKKAGYFI